MILQNKGHKRGRAAWIVSALVGAMVASSVAGLPAQAADEVASVDFAVGGGQPQHLASGTIYGLTEDGSLPQDHFYTDIR